MTDRMDFFRHSETMMAFYANGQYDAALKVTEQLAVEFPDESATTSFWRICLLSRLGKTNEALSSMSTVMKEGMWWSEEQLRADDDLAPLQGLPAFEVLVSECKTRQTAAQKDAKPNALIRLPTGDAPYPLLVALHGRGSSPERDFRYWEPILQMGWMLAMPQSAQLGSPDTFVWDDAALAMEQVAEQFNQLLERSSIERDKVIVAGFSQGAGLAIQVCLRGLIHARGFLAIVPGKNVMQDLEEHFPVKNDLRGYLVAGGRDPRHEMFNQIHALLNQKGVACEMEDHPQMGHEFPKDFERSISKALKFLFAETVKR